MKTCLLTALLGLEVVRAETSQLSLTCDVGVDITRLVFHLISTIFLLLTLLLYLLEPALRKRYLYSLFNMSLLANVTVAYSLVIINSILNIENFKIKATIGCQVIGYLKLYFFSAFFFWTNCMAFDVYRKFKNMYKGQFRLGNKKKQDRFQYLCCFCYAQGVPVVMVIVTALVDSQGPLEEEGREYLPNMGTYECFFGSPDITPRQSFFTTPEFIYYDAILLLINIANVFFFCSAMKAIRATYLNKEQLRINQEEEVDASALRKELRRIVKIFCVTGVWWIFEFIGANIVWCLFGRSCLLEMFLDVPCMLIGVVIFALIVCKRSVLKSLRRRLEVIFSKGQTKLLESDKKEGGF